MTILANCLKTFALLLMLACPLQSEAQGCPPWLASMKSPALSTTRFKNFCDLLVAFESAQDRIRSHFDAQGLNMQSPALRLKGVYGPRLVDYSSDYIGWLGVRAHGDPWWIYSTQNGQDPTPDVFSKWQDAALWIDAGATDNRAAATQGRAMGLPPIDASFITNIHTKAFHGLVDWGIDLPPDTYDGFRHGHLEFGYYYRDQAIPEHTFDHLKYPVDAQGLPTPDAHPMGEFHPIHCMDELPRELSPREEALVFPNGRRDSDGKVIGPNLKIKILEALDQNPSLGFDSLEGGKTVRKQCGYFTFLPADQIPLRITEALENISLAIADWYQPRPSKPPVDPLLMAARIEHWLIGIHPFNDGNGRTIRLVADYVLGSVGLPAPLYWTTLDDMNFMEQGWAEKIAQGMERAQNTLEVCADYLEGKPVKPAGPIEWKDLCSIVPMTPTVRPW